MHIFHQSTAQHTTTRAALCSVPSSGTSFHSVHCQSALCCDAQTELNSREGAWERLCTERDPLVLSSLMWSWLEQLKDPVISGEDIKALSEKNVNPQNTLDSLEKVAGLDHCLKHTLCTHSHSTIMAQMIIQNILQIFFYTFLLFYSNRT